MKLLKRYLFWTYERGSFHYDVMVTLILLFLFIAPHVINFHDRPEEHPVVGREVLVHAGKGSAFTFEVAADQIPDTHNTDKLRAELKASIAPLAGPVEVERWQAIKDASGKVTSYKVWASR